ncbi:putative secreted protein (type I secretion substrate) [Enterovirga rhinocerotis]|uniref:Putative secreted protein (Type I secretion substrate) n=2 Tax=Enterovirga rhinocerotis TaxID=1339210 RepID=A0A4R7C110_9HYPH|nr:putative secreted protein (type I secretion substrate) [Enterovirga rhinocerotis]
MVGGVGNDTYFVDSARDQVIETARGGTDRVSTTVSYTLAAGSEIEHFDVDGAASTTAIDLTGNEFAQTIVGNAGNNKIDGKGGADIMRGLGGDDAYYVDSARDQVLESVGGGHDRVSTTTSYVLTAGSEIEHFAIYGAASTTAINLTGNGFAQTIIGNNGDNKIDGKAGADILRGLGGRDILTGGTGADTFLFTALSDSTVDGAGRDLIQDFYRSHGDRIDLRPLDANSQVAGNQAFSFIGTKAFSHQAGELRATVSGGYTVVSGDVNGDGRADFAISLRNHINLRADDFYL